MNSRKKEDFEEKEHKLYFYNRLSNVMKLYKKKGKKQSQPRIVLFVLVCLTQFTFSQLPYKFLIFIYLFIYLFFCIS